MKWSMVNKVNSSDFWILEEDGKTISELRYNIPARTLRINESAKRLFFLEQTGFLQTRIQLKNEYNQVNGELQFNKNSNTGIIILSENKYSFTASGDSLLVKTNNGESCSITISGEHKPDVFEVSALLFAYCNHLHNAAAEKMEYKWRQ